jgi:2-polyprenyl-6-methoxyphenol hydroxylase-like FAD-dependent oxidoreductase
MIGPLQMHESSLQTGCCIVGAGPAGAMLALLLARQGIDVTLLEAHTDFERDFRGDTLHPATLELIDQLGLIDRLLQIPHGRIGRMILHTRAGAVTFRAPANARSRYSDTLLLPQARFLELLIAEARRHPSFHLVFGARAETLIEEQGVIHGVRYRDQSSSHELRALLTVGTDGRFSKVRQQAGLEPVANAQPIDLLWFRLPRLASDAADAGGIYAGDGRIMVMLGRATEWQISYWMRKGGYHDLRAAGLEELRRSVTTQAPWLGDRTAALQDWHQMALLMVESSRLRRWYRPGVLLVGDAAHVMSMVGGVGINLAIQDAVAASNLLGPRLKQGVVRTRDLAAVQRRREWPVRIIQRIQDVMMRQLLAASEISGTGPARLPFGLRLIQRVPLVLAFRDRLFAYGGFRPERVKPTRTNSHHPFAID